MSDLSESEPVKWTTTVTDKQYEKIMEVIENAKREFIDAKTQLAVSRIESAITLAILFRSEDI